MRAFSYERARSPAEAALAADCAGHAIVRAHAVVGKEDDLQVRKIAETRFEIQRGEAPTITAQIGAGWDPHWHQPTDRYSTFSDKDFRLGLNAAQTTLAAIALLTGATVKK